MKKLAYLICLPALLISSCTNHYNCCTVAQPTAKVTAEKNGASWSPAFAGGVLSSQDSLSISATGAAYDASVNKKTDNFNIKIKYNTPGSFQLKSGQAFYGTFTNNALTTGYQLDESYNNVINITGHDRLSNPYSSVPDEVKITGTFSLKFIDPNNPSGITFQSGSFFALVPYL
jgi:hypothetical protein